MMINFTRLLKNSCLAFLFITLLFQQASANHVAGGYVSYKWLGGLSYEFTATFYRDCSGITPPPVQMEIDFIPLTTCGGGGYRNAPQVPPSGVEIGTPCPGATFCSGGTTPGYRKYVYKTTTVTFPFACSDWKISFRPSTADAQQLGRNMSITTLVPNCLDNFNNPIQCVMYTETKLDNVNHANNNSVVFTNDPILYVCAGQNATFNLGAYDADGDSLTYELVTARKADPSLVLGNVTYVSPLSGQDPLFPVGSVSVNRFTGDISINTPTAQVGVIDVMVREYRNGVQVGSVIIEMQVVVNACSNIYPTLSGINGTSLFTDTVCPGDTVNFNLYANDPDAGQIVTMSWDTALSSPANFAISGSPNPTGQFTWPTKASDARSQPYVFNVSVKDDNCPTNGLVSHTYQIYVIGPKVSVSPPSAQLCNGQSVSLTAAGSGSFSWSPSTGLSSTTGAVVSATPSVTTTYTITSTSGNCVATASVTVTVTPLAAAAGPDTTVCPYEFVPLHATGGANYSWSPATGLDNPNISNPTAILLNSTTYTVTISNGNCVATKTVTVNVRPFLKTPLITQSNDTLYCSIDPSYSSYQWYFNTVLIPGATNPNLYVTQGGNYNVAVYDEYGCGISVGIILGTNESNLLQGHDLYLYPNPAGEHLFIRCNELAMRNNTKVSVFNVVGEQVMVEYVKQLQNQPLNIKLLPAGIYLLQAENEKGKWMGRFVKE